MSLNMLRSWARNKQPALISRSVSLRRKLTLNNGPLGKLTLGQDPTHQRLCEAVEVQHKYNRDPGHSQGRLQEYNGTIGL